MADGVLFVGWGEAIPGREATALLVFGEAVQYWTSLQQSGKIESFEAFALDPHGDLVGFALLRGDRATLAQVRNSDDFVRINARAQMAVQHFGVVGGVTGGEMQRLFALFEEQVRDLSA
jgi:hypothetical protein